MTTALKSLIAINPTINLGPYIQTGLSLLKDFSRQRLITQGSVLHGHLFKMGLTSDKHIAVKLLIMYLNSRRSFEVDQLLKDFNGFDMIVHNCLISAKVDWGSIDEARRLFDEMPERNEVSWTALISGFLKCGRVEEAMWYFARNPFNNVISWTAVISGFVQNGLDFKAMELFLVMVKSGVRPNEVTFTSVVRACAGLGDIALGVSVLCLVVKLGFVHNVSVCNSLITFYLRLGKFDLARGIFERMEERDVVSWTAILDMYVGMGDLKEARRIFDEMPERNEVSWSAMIARYSQSGHAKEAVELFYRMVGDGFRPNSSCFSSAINALTGLEALQSGKNIHSFVVKIGKERDVFVCSSLIDLYSKCGNTEDGRLVFDTIQENNVVCWNSLISGYSANGQLEEAKKLFDHLPEKSIGSWNSMLSGYVGNEQFSEVFQVFNDMLMSGERPDKSTFSSVLCACAHIASLEKGKDLHGKIFKLGFQYDTFVGTALTDMYAKAGDIESSRQVFNRMPQKNEITWTAMIQGLAENGFVKESVLLFEEMERVSSIKANELILLAVLFACSHCGLIDKGLQYFNSMEKVYGVKPSERHYTCMVDMLSRSGQLADAENLIMSMPCVPEVNAWAALLSGCKTYGEEQIAERTARKIRELAEKKSGGYILLSNVYASVGRWIDVQEIRKLMREKGLKKSGGCSWVEVKNELHLFYSQDGNHSRSSEIYGVLELLKFDMLIL